MTNYDYGWRKVFLIKILLLLPFYYWEILQTLKVTPYLSHTTAAFSKAGCASVGVLVHTIDLRPQSLYHHPTSFCSFLFLLISLQSHTGISWSWTGSCWLFPHSSFLGKKTCLSHSPLLLLFWLSLWFIFPEVLQ